MDVLSPEPKKREQSDPTVVIASPKEVVQSGFEEIDIQGERINGNTDIPTKLYSRLCQVHIHNEITVRNVASVH